MEEYGYAVISDKIQDEIEEFQQQLKKETNRDIVLIAYEKLVNES